MEISGKVAIVTGASGGIGLATATLLTKLGARVALVARSGEKLKNISKRLTDSFPAIADMSKANEVKVMINKVYKHYGRVDILVNNAGQGYDSLIEKTDLKTLRRLFELDVIGALVAMQAAIPIMRQQGGGSIINVSSGTALMALPNMAAYSGLKRMLTGISLTAAAELEADHIKVSVVYPYITTTDFDKNTITEKPEREWHPENQPGLRPPDSAEYVAEKIVEGIKTGDAEIFVHEWMKKL